MTFSPDTTLRERTFSRLKTSIAGEKCDAHSVFNFYTYPFYHSLTQVNLFEYFNNPKLCFEIQLEVLEKLEMCGSFAPDTGVVAEGSGLGGKVSQDSKGFLNIHPADIEDIDDLKDLKPGDPYGDNYMRKALETLEYMLAHAPAGYKVNQPNVMAPFTAAAQLRGISDFCMDTLLDEDFTFKLLDITTETCINYLKACEKTMGSPLHHVLLSDDLSSFLNPTTYEKYVMPCYKRIFAEFPQSQYWLHNDAEASHVAHLIGQTGWDAWQYAPSLDSMETLKATQGKVTLMGGISPLAFQSTTPEETYNICTEKLKSFQGESRMVLGVGGSVNQIPVDNLLAILKAADDFKI